MLVAILKENTKALNVNPSIFIPNRNARASMALNFFNQIHDVAK